MLCSPAVSKFQRLLVLEVQHGPLPGTTPALTDVIDYLENVGHAELPNSEHITAFTTWLLHA